MHALAPEEQYLVATGRTYFRDLSFDHLHRMQFDLETTGLNPDRDRIFMIAVRYPSGTTETLEAPREGNAGESALIRELTEKVSAVDPDVIENHNLHGFDLPFLGRRAQILGVPLALASQEEIRQDAHNAVRCALAMRTKLEELHTQWKERGLPLSGMRIGIHTGPLVAGSLGSAERQEYTVIGDSVNTASRLESFDKEWVDPDLPGDDSRCRILISEATHLFISGEFQTKRVGTMTLKNKNEPVTVYRLLAENK